MSTSLVSEGDGTAASQQCCETRLRDLQAAWSGTGRSGSLCSKGPHRVLKRLEARVGPVGRLAHIPHAGHHGVQGLVVRSSSFCRTLPHGHMVKWQLAGGGAADLHAWQSINADALGPAVQDMHLIHPIQHQALRQQPSDAHHRGADTGMLQQLRSCKARHRAESSSSSSSVLTSAAAPVSMAMSSVLELAAMNLNRFSRVPTTCTPPPAFNSPPRPWINHAPQHQSCRQVISSCSCQLGLLLAFGSSPKGRGWDPTEAAALPGQTCCHTLMLAPPAMLRASGTAITCRLICTETCP